MDNMDRASYLMEGVTYAIPVHAYALDGSVYIFDHTRYADQEGYLKKSQLVLEFPIPDGEIYCDIQFNIETGEEVRSTKGYHIVRGYKDLARPILKFERSR
jgi:hypothetical protein